MSSQWVDVGGADDVSETAPLAVVVDGRRDDRRALRRELYAVEDRCTHDGEPLGEAPVEDCQITCPRHGAHFCLRTGRGAHPAGLRAAAHLRGARTRMAACCVELPAVRAAREAPHAHAPRRRALEGRRALGPRAPAQPPRHRAPPRAMARRLLELELVPDLVLVSPARRTQQTAEIVARELALPGAARAARGGAVPGERCRTC